MDSIHENTALFRPYATEIVGEFDRPRDSEWVVSPVTQTVPLWAAVARIHTTKAAVSV